MQSIVGVQGLGSVVSGYSSKGVSDEGRGR